MADNEMNLILKLKDEFSKNSDKVKNGVSSLQKSFEGLKDKIRIGAAASFTMLSLIIKKSVDAFAEEEKAIIQLKAALKSTGQEVNNNAKEMIKYASELQRVTTVGDETSIALMQVATNMGLNSKQAQQATKDAIGLSKAYGVDTQAAIKAVSAAQLGDYNMLNRYIPALRSVKDETEKAAMAKRLLASAFDVAKSETQTYSGAMLQLKNSIGDASEKIGAALAPALTAIAKVIGTVVEWFNNLTPSAQKASGIMIGVATVVSVLALAFTFLTWPIIATAAAIAAVVAGFIMLKEATAPLAEKTNQLTQEHDKLQNKLKETNEQLKELQKQGLENSSQYLKLQNELDNTNKKLTENEKKLRDNINALADQKKAIEAKIAAQKKDVEAASGNKKIKELEQLEALEAQKKEIIAASKDAETALLLRKNEEQNTATTEQSLAQSEAKKAYDEEMKATDYEQKIADQEAQIAYKDELFQAELVKLGTDEAAKAQLTANYNRVRAADDKKIQDLQNKQKEQQSKDFATWENFMLAGAKSKNKEVAAIAKGLAIKNIIFKTAEAAMGAFNSMVGIPVIGPALGMAAAGAAIAFGAEQIQQVQSAGVEMAEGGIIPATPGGVNVKAAEAGKDEAFIPLDDPDAQSRLGGGDTELHIYIDGVEVAASVVKGYNKGRNLNMIGKLTEV